MTPPPTCTAAELVERYEVVLLDSYGVLVDSAGALPGADRLLAELRDAGRRFLVVSNDASRTTASAVARYRERGLELSAEQVLTSGDLVGPYVQQRGLAGKRCVVLGPADSIALVSNAGGLVVPPDDPQLDAVFVCDDDGYPFRETIETVIATLYTRLAAGHEVALVLPNPDLVYPRGHGRFGLTAGSVATLIEDALAIRFTTPPRFVGLGKPHPPIFEHALRRLGVSAGRHVVMVGDQIATDIAGARGVGIDSALIGTGVCTRDDLPASPRPDWWLPDLDSGW